MAELKLPVDFERLPEYRTMQSLLLKDATPRAAAYLRSADCIALFIYLRLWVDLAYQASVTKPLGFLPTNSEALFLDNLGEEVAALQPMALLRDSGILRQVEGGHLCERFARCNEHLSPDFSRAVDKGAAHSAMVRGKRKVGFEAMQQAMLLPPSVMKRKDGTVMNGTEINRVLVCIKTIDNCLKQPARNNSQFTEGLMADAAEVVARYSPEQLDATYFWILDNRTHPGLPQTTEQILANFGALTSFVSDAKSA